MRRDMFDGARADLRRSFISANVTRRSVTRKSAGTSQACGPKLVATILGYNTGLLRKPLAQETRARKAVTPRLLRGLGNADADAHGDIGMRRACAEFERRCIERQAVVRAGDLERLGEAAGAGAQEPLVGDP